MYEDMDIFEFDGVTDSKCPWCKEPLEDYILAGIPEFEDIGQTMVRGIYPCPQCGKPIMIQVEGNCLTGGILPEDYEDLDEGAGRWCDAVDCIDCRYHEILYWLCKVEVESKKQMWIPGTKELAYA